MLPAIFLYIPPCPSSCPPCFQFLLDEFVRDKVHLLAASETLRQRGKNNCNERNARVSFSFANPLLMKDKCHFWHTWEGKKRRKRLQGSADDIMHHSLKLGLHETFMLTPHDNQLKENVQTIHLIYATLRTDITFRQNTLFLPLSTIVFMTVDYI